MDAKFYPNVTDPKELKEMLEANADAVEHLGYSRTLPSDEVDSLQEQLASTQIKIDSIEDELKAEKQKREAKIKELKQARRNISDKLKSRSEYVEEDCYKMVDQKTREVGYYNIEGDLVYSRPARKDELQTTIFSTIRKTGTDDK